MLVELFFPVHLLLKRLNRTGFGEVSKFLIVVQPLRVTVRLDNVIYGQSKVISLFTISAVLAVASQVFENLMQGCVLAAAGLYSM